MTFANRPSKKSGSGKRAVLRRAVDNSEILESDWEEIDHEEPGLAAMEAGIGGTYIYMDDDTVYVYGNGDVLVVKAANEEIHDSHLPEVNQGDEGDSQQFEESFAREEHLGGKELSVEREFLEAAMFRDSAEEIRRRDNFGSLNELIEEEVSGNELIDEDQVPGGMTGDSDFSEEPRASVMDEALRERLQYFVALPPSLRLRQFGRMSRMPAMFVPQFRVTQNFPLARKSQFDDDYYAAGVPMEGDPPNGQKSQFDDDYYAAGVPMEGDPRLFFVPDIEEID